MNAPQLKRRKWNYPALAFAIPSVSMLVLMLIRGFSPFGSYSMLYSDMYHQYYPFFKAFRQALRSGDSLLYSWNVGMGMDYLGLISYYLASPLNLLSVLVPEGWLLQYFSLLMPIKLGFAGFSFAWMLKKLRGKDDLSISLFGACYALCAWALGYQWNIMWLDTFALLPLVVLGTVRLLRDKKVILYTLTLFLSVFANYYIGFFTCIFVLLVFICYQICRCKSAGRFFADLFRIGLFSLLAIGMTAILELPALAALQNTQSSVNAFPTGFRLNIADENTWKGLLDAMRQVAGNMGGGLEPTFKEGLPNLYCGVGSVILAFLYLTRRDIRLREKLCAVALLIFFSISFIIRQLDYIWHGFHFTNMIPYRFSFLYSFVVLYMAYEAWLRRRSFRPWQLALAGALYVGVILCSESRTDGVFLAFNIGFLVFYLAALAIAQLRRRLPADADREAISLERARRKQLRRCSSWLLLTVMGLEILLNVVNFGVRFPGTNASNYPKGTSDTLAVVDAMEQREQDTLFYRAEVTHTQTLNDGALIGYNGVSTFTSSANVRVTEFMKALGYAAKNTYNRYCFEDGSPVANLFLNLKYMIERESVVKDNRYFDTVYASSDVTLLENNACLPLGFLAEPELAELDFSGDTNAFLLQDKLFHAATGLTGDVWYTLQDSALTVTAESATLTGQVSRGYCSYAECESGAAIVYTYQIGLDGFLCINLDLSDRNSYTVSKNGQQLYSESISLPQMIAVGDVQAGDVVEIRMSCQKGEDGHMTIRAGILNDTLFRKGVDKLSAATLELTEFSNTRIRGEILCDRDGLLYTSIPDDGNWTATVDGQPVELTLTGNAMAGILLTEGTHTVEFTYRNAAFSLGWKVSLGCLVVFLFFVLAAYPPRTRKGKYDRK